MNYYIAYEAVIKKSKTMPPNLFIGNIEMAAGIGIVMKELGKSLDTDNINEPEDIKTRFLETVKNENMDSLSEESKVIIGLVENYQVKKMVNETIENIKDLAQYKFN